MRRRAIGRQGARPRLMTAALAAFAAHGFEGATTHAIAAAAGSPQGLVRHHFGSKAGLWQAVVDDAIARLLLELQARPDGLTVAAWLGLVERYVELSAVLLHAVLEGGDRAALVRVGVAPVLAQLVAFQRRAQPNADREQLALWLAASLALPLLQRGRTEGRERAIDTLFAWLTTTPSPVAAGPFALHTARLHLRGAS